MKNEELEIRELGIWRKYFLHSVAVYDMLIRLTDGSAVMSGLTEARGNRARLRRRERWNFLANATSKRVSFLNPGRGKAPKGMS